MEGSKLELGIGTRDLSQIAALAALFVIASAIPLTAFIGGAGFITLGIIFVPVIARMLKPRAALIAGLAGSLAVYALQIGTAPVFGPVSLLIPISGIVLGSLGFHYKFGSVAPWAYVLLGALYYLAESGGTLLWLAPYVVTILSLPLLLRRTKLQLPLFCLYSTMCELTTMNIASISILKLPGQLWSVIALLMFLERAVATAGSTLVIVGLRRGLPSFIGEEQNV